MRFNHLLLFAVFAWTLTIPEIYEIGGSWGVFDWIRGWINWLIRWPVNGFRRFWNATVAPFLGDLWQGIQDVYKWTSTELTKAYNWTRDQIEYAYRWTSTELTKAYNWTRDQIEYAYRWTSTELSKAYNWTRDQIEYAYRWTSTELSKAYNWVKDQLEYAYRWTSTELSKAYNWVKDQVEYVFRWTIDQLEKLISSLLGEDGLIMRTVKAFIGAIYDALVWFVELIWGGV